MLGVSLVLIFSWIPMFSRNQNQWRNLILPLILYFLLAAYYQILRGEYLYVLTSTRISDNHAIVMLSIELFYAASQFVQSNQTLSHFIFAGLCISFISFFRSSYGVSKRAWPFFLKAFVGFLVAASLLLPIVTNFVYWNRFVRNIQWMSLYFYPAILVLLAMGFVFFSFRFLHKTELNSFAACLVILFLVPAVVYLLNPLIPRDQPWGIRRFVPVVFPLFFLISLGGWLAFLQRLFRIRALQKAMFSLLMILTASAFYGMSGYLLKDRLYNSLTPQVTELCRGIPSNALILIPESWAGIHLEMPLQYSMGLDTLLVPMRGMVNNKLTSVISNYLARQVPQRPVVILYNGSEDLPRYLRSHFRYEFQFRRNLSFALVSRTRQMIFPDHSDNILLDITAFTLQKNNSITRNAISYDDPNISFVNFHGKENGFRWTTERSTIEGFAFPTLNKKVVATLSTIPDYSKYSGNGVGLRLIVNEEIPTNLVQESNGNYVFEIDGEMIGEINRATIESKTFVPVDQKINSDPRRLGISFRELRFDRR